MLQLRTTLEMTLLYAVYAGLFFMLVHAAMKAFKLWTLRLRCCFWTVVAVMSIFLAGEPLSSLAGPSEFICVAPGHLVIIDDGLAGSAVPPRG